MPFLSENNDDLIDNHFNINPEEQYSNYIAKKAQENSLLNSKNSGSGINSDENVSNKDFDKNSKASTSKLNPNIMNDCLNEKKLNKMKVFFTS